MASEQQNVFARAAKESGLGSLSTAGLQSLAQLRQSLDEHYSPEFIRDLHETAQKANRDARTLEKKVLTRQSPLLPALIRQGLRHPDVSLQDFQEWFGGRFGQYANPGDVASAFSPAAYLTALYREARALYPKGNRFHIDVRRPDLKNLPLSQNNMTDEVSALSLSNEIMTGLVYERMALKPVEGDSPSDQVLEKLSGHMTSSDTPYHHHHARLREVRSLKDPEFRQLLAAPVVTKHLSGPTLAGIYYNISPVLADILTEAIPDDEVAEKLFEKYFPKMTPEMVLNPLFLRRWYGLSDKEVSEMMELVGKSEAETLPEGEYVGNTMLISMNEGLIRLNYTITGVKGTKPEYFRIYPLGGSRVTFKIKYSQELADCSRWGIAQYLRHDEAGSEPISKGPEQNPGAATEYTLPSFTLYAPDGSQKPEAALQQHYNFWIAREAGVNDVKEDISTIYFSISAYSSAKFVLKLNKIIRLYKATGLSPRVLEDVINSVDPTGAVTHETLTVLFRAPLLARRYGVSHEDALVMTKSHISMAANGSEPSHWDRLFNSPALSVAPFVPGGAVSLDPALAGEDAEIKATLKRACQTDDEGLYDLALCLNKKQVSGMKAFSLTQQNVSALYALSLWARGHGVAPRELSLLLSNLGLEDAFISKPPETWLAMLESLYATLQWLVSAGWTVADLHLMTRDVTEIPPGTEILNAAAQLKDVVRAEPEVSEPDGQIARLAPAVAGIFSLDHQTAALALLRWQNAARTGGMDVAALWKHLRPQADDTGNPLPDKPLDDKGVVAFCYSLAQMALICHGTGVQPDALMLFVDNPSCLAETTKSVLPRTVPVLKALCAFTQWRTTLQDSAGAGASLLNALAEGHVDAALLAQATGIGEVRLAQALAAAKEKGDIPAVTLESWEQIQAVLQWHGLSDVFGVTPDDIGLLLTLDYQAKPRAGWSIWKRVADAFSAGLTLSQSSRLADTAAEALSGALAGYLTSGAARDWNLHSREALHRYLLSDNLNGPQLRTSRLAEAIAALQQFIHRVLSLSPLDRGNPESADIQRTVLDRQFFRDWVRWNARYSTWAAGQKLMFYPENYIDPTVRLGQTEMMDNMLQSLGQAQINTDTVGDAFMGYLAGFEEVANLLTISSYHDSADPKAGKTWFVGRSQAEPREYWWRLVDEGRRGPDGTLPANAWTGWTKITCVPQVYGDLIRPVVYRSRLYVAWVERQRVQVGEENGKETWRIRWTLKMSMLRYDGSWGAPVVHEYDNEKLKGLDDIGPETLSLYLSTWEAKQCMFAGVYPKGVSDAKEFAGEVAIYEDMSVKPDTAITANWTTTQPYLDQRGQNRVVVPFRTAPLYAENTLTNATPLPGNFTRFDYSDLSVSVLSEDDTGSEYNLRMGITLTAEIKMPEVSSLWIARLIKNSSLATLKGQVRVIYSQHYSTGGVFITTTINGQGWAYCIFSKEKHPLIANWKEMRDENSDKSWGNVIQDDDWVIAEFPIGNPEAPYEMIRFQAKRTDDVIVRGDAISYIDYGGRYIQQGRITPEWYLIGYPGVIPSTEIGVSVAQPGEIDEWLYSQSSYDFRQGPQSITWGAGSIFPVTNGKKFTFSGTEVKHTVSLMCGENFIRTWKLRVYKKAEGDLTVDVIGVQETSGERAQYLEHQMTLSSSVVPGVRTRLNTLFARQLTAKASGGIDAILNYRTQLLPEPPLTAGENGGVMDFSGANAIYFWELFYYTPMMVMQRFLNEERYDLAEQWLRYIFSPSGYLVEGKPEARMWNVRPLQEDTEWNDDPLKSYDPDAVAQNDPMHYKLNAWMRQLDIIMGRGDAAYRKLERDTLAEAKVWYGRALDLLGEAPWIMPNANWNNPLLGKVADDALLQARMEVLDSLLRGVPVEDGTRSGLQQVLKATQWFYPEANAVLLGYWDAVRIRLYNLRHNLTLDGQPMSLPLFATPADPKALLAAAVAAEGGAGNALPSVTTIPTLRFTPMLESARSMASQLIQFGSTMQQILISQDGEALAELLSTQGAELANSSLMLQKQTLKELQAERTTLEKTLETATTRFKHYRALYDENISSREVAAMNLSFAAEIMGAVIKPIYVAGAVSGLAPNVFGLANGGMKYEGPINAIGMGLEMVSTGLQVSSNRLTTEEQYRRRRQEWDIQQKAAEKEMAVIQAQLDALAVRQTSAEMQIAHMEMQSAHAQAQLALFRNKLTGKAMYSWLRGRLATIFYQYYDLTASLCLMAQLSLQYETGDTSKSWLRTGTWDGAWAGLMSGEGLMLSLAQMEVAWMKHQKRELEVTRTVSLAKFLDGKLVGDDDGVLSLSDAIRALIAGGTEASYGEGLNRVGLTQDKQLGVHFSLKDLGLSTGFSGAVRIRSIAISLPALLGPYDDVRGTLRTNVSSDLLPSGCNQCAISHALRDNGMFVQDGTGDPRWGARWLPFEGMNVNDDKGMTLSFAEATGDQKTLLESLNDIILHIQFTVR